MSDAVRLAAGETTAVSPEYRRLVGSNVGVVRDVRSYRPPRGDPTLFTCFAEATTPGGRTLAGVGGGRTRTESVDRAVRTALVRYCRRVGPPVEAVADGGPTPLPDAADATGPASSESAANGVDPDESREWLRGVDLRDGTRRGVPASLVADGVQATTPPPYAIGYGCDPAPGSAVLRGLLACVARDAAMRTWFGRSSPARYRLGSAPSLRRLVGERFENDFLSVHAFALDSPTALPAVGCLLADERGRPPGVSVGVAADLGERRAVEKALVRAGSRWTRAKRVLANGDASDGTPDQFRESVERYARPGSREDLSFLLGGDAREVERPDDPPSSPGARLEGALAGLGGETPTCVPLTTADVADAGVTVVGVVVPELLPLVAPSAGTVAHPDAPSEGESGRAHPFGVRTV